MSHWLVAVLSSSCNRLFTIVISNNESFTNNNNNLDVSKEVFVVDYTNIWIQKFDTDGKSITKWGTEGTDDNQFQDLHGVVIY